MLVRASLILLVAIARLLAAQGGFLAGAVRDRSGTPVAGAEVQIQSDATGARQKLSCDEQGRYVSTELAAGTYKVTIRSHAFRTVTQPGVMVRAGQTQTADFVIELLPLQQEITVESTRDESDPAGNGVAVSRQSPTSTLPENGRDLHAFYALVPGGDRDTRFLR
ncbi:MAG: carboxypeptidase-like regulatory domain-containing protein [Bryobacteraceae bacterium]